LRYICFIFSFLISFILLGCGTKTPSVASYQKHTKPSINYNPKNIQTLLHYTLSTNQSAFYPLDDPRDAFSARIYLIDHSTNSIDVQYYIYEDDISGAIFSYHLLQAAKRGVNVNILIDDLDTSGKDKAWLLLTMHPNIHLKLFNPIYFRKTLRFAKLAFNIDSLGKRMHNKALIIDDSVAIIGGRNIGNIYYATGDDTLFLDFDMLCAGEIVKDIKEMFLVFYHSHQAEEATAILDAKISQKEIQKEEKILISMVKQFKQTSIADAMLHSEFIQKVQTFTLELSLADAQFYYDLPQKVKANPTQKSYSIAHKIDQEIYKIQKEILIISPYFIPTKKMMEKFIYLRKKGIKITVITNSLASNDVFLVYSGYQKYIYQLLNIGVKLYELKPQSFHRLKKQKRWLTQNKVSLHTKLMILDKRYIGLGSANLDPRSIELNTEIFMIIDSKKLALELLQKTKKSIISDDFIKVTWGEIPVPYTLKDIKFYGPIYKTTENGKEKTYYNPPYSGFFKTLGTNILSYFPIEGYL